MFDFFDRLFGYIEIVFDFFLNIIKTLITALGVLSQSATIVVHLTGYMPTMIATGVVVFSAIMICKFLIGR